MARIVPLGLTPNEAKGWYIHYVLMPWLFKGIIAIGLGSVAVFSMLTPLIEYLESTLALHMVAQHVLFMVAGFLIAYGLDSLVLVASRLSRKVSGAYSFLLKANSILNKWGLMTFIVAALLIAYWYLPANFNAAVLSESVHIEMHFTIFAAGGLVFVGSKLLTKRAQRIAPIIAGKAVGLYGAIMLLTPAYLYPAYPVSEQVETGVVMVVLMVVLDMTLMPIWLYNYFGKGAVSRSS